MNRESLGAAAYRFSSALEAFNNPVPKFIKEWDSFHDMSCLRCDWYQITRSKLREKETMTENELICRDWLEHYWAENPQPPRKLHPVKGDFMWCFICEMCIEIKTNKNGY